MAEEPTMKLYMLAIAAMHTTGDQTAVGVRSALALLPDGANLEEASQQVARSVFPESDGWSNHYTNAQEIPQGFPLDPYRLTWRVEKE
jgi:hypothetical protein